MGVLRGLLPVWGLLRSRTLVFPARSGQIKLVSGRARFLSSSPTMLSERTSLPDIPLFRNVVEHADSVAIGAVDSNDEVPYNQLLHAAVTLGETLRAKSLTGNLDGQAVCFLVRPGPNYVTVMLATWIAGGMAVPLHVGHPEPELRYCINMAQPKVLIADADLEAKVKPIGESNDIELLTLSSFEAKSSSEQYEFTPVSKTSRALMIFTSGTTGKPKGVVTSHGGLEHQISDLVNAWEWTANDRIPHFLPLHHVHGIVNKMLCPLFAGATVEFTPPSAAHLWQLLIDSLHRKESSRFTLFMAVPTIYALMLKELETMDDTAKAMAMRATSGLRLMVSGSAACPVPVINRWKDATGHTLLERYGMTELGMALSNPYNGERLPGYVGMPLPSVDVRIVDDDGETRMTVSGKDLSVTTSSDEQEIQGMLQVKGETVFQEYWRNAEATAKEFTEDGWFITGDVAAFSRCNNSIRICGRASIDIIKSGGYKISALDIEKVLLEHPQIEQAAVVGVPDETWGEVVGAVLVWRSETDPSDQSRESVRKWMEGKIAGYKSPQIVVSVEELPKNAMGKVVKTDVKKLL